jgi:FMN-dependent NADH-azoreductase
MEKILFINACVRPNSRTLELANYVLTRLSGKVEEVELYKEDLSPLTLEEMEVRNKSFKNKDFSNEIFTLSKQFACADVIVIAAPYWDMMFPAVVKNYFEKITVNGLTFAYGENGIPYGLCKAKKLIYVTTSGGPIVYNFGFDYVNALAKCFYNIPEVQFVSAEGLDVYGSDVTKIINETKRAFNPVGVD